MPTDLKQWNRNNTEITNEGTPGLDILEKSLEATDASNPKHPGNRACYEKRKPKNNSNRRWWRFQIQGAENIFNKIIEEKLPNTKKKMAINI